MKTITWEMACRQFVRHAEKAYSAALRDDFPGCVRHLGWMAEWQATAIGLASR